jgi:hypothetical protein
MTKALLLGVAFLIAAIAGLVSLVRLGKVVLAMPGRISNRVVDGEVPPVMKPLIRALRKANSKIQILAAELDLRLFNHPEVTTAFNLAIKKDVEIEIICGPLIVTDKSGKNPFWETYRGYRNVKFYLRTKQRNIHHGTIVDDGAIVILEDYHPPGAPERNVYVYPTGHPNQSANAWIDRFERHKTSPDTVELTLKEFHQCAVPFSTPAQLEREYDHRNLKFRPPQGMTGDLLRDMTVDF